MEGRSIRLAENVVNLRVISKRLHETDNALYGCLKHCLVIYNIKFIGLFLS